MTLIQHGAKQNVDDLPTPALLVEQSRLEGNIASMQARANEADVRLRPHTKTHKSVALARLQQSAGAKGITVAKVSEAEVFAAAGFNDIRIAYDVVGAGKIRRIAELSKTTKVSFCVDTADGARQASAVLAEAAVDVDVLIEIDTGQGRTGVPWDDDDVVGLARVVSTLPGLRYVGVLTHGGYGYYGPKGGESAEEALRRAAGEEQGRIGRVVKALRGAGHPPTEVSIGSTPTLRYLGESQGSGEPVITEVRPGNYVFHDRTQVGLGVVGWQECALTVLTTVVSRRRDHDGTERLYLDAGKKVFTSDGAFGAGGFGQILYNARRMVPLPHADIVGLSEEHAWVSVLGGSTLEVGDRVRVVPNHACVVVNNMPVLHVVDGDEVVETWDVDARGCVE